MHFKSFLLSTAIFASHKISASAFTVFDKSATLPTRETALHAKNILLAFDGTGNNARDFAPNEDHDRTFTNVLRLHLLAGGDINGKRNDIPGQISLYERGIGAKSDNEQVRLLRKAGGDLSRQTKPMRERLEKVYEPGDKLYLIGFSRGASAARNFATELYKDGLTSKNGEKVHQPPIEFMGCFETVSMQVKKRLFRILFASKKNRITKSTVLGEDGKVAPNVKKAVHNVALDDNRQFEPLRCFPPVLMGTEERVHEAWFAGEHGDVGGSFYTKGISDCSCVYMKEWIESLDDSLKFMKAVDINEECLKIDDYPDVKITAEDLILVPDPSGKIHQDEKHHRTPSYRLVHVLKNDKKVEGGVVNVHESVLLHAEAKKKEGTPYPVNPNLKEIDFVVVGSLGEVSGDKTKRLKALLDSDY
mmetsp:Transcript_18398/g.27948  ORF Transcript_18398/g.27948 Transcript_18398/m.27948 type:complete len:418 (-) Transcript_18398:269-1522(-)